MKHLIILVAFSLSNVALAQNYSDTDYKDWLSRMEYEGKTDEEKIKTMLKQDQLQTSHDLKFLDCRDQKELNKKISSLIEEKKSVEKVYSKDYENYVKTRKEAVQLSLDSQSDFYGNKEFAELKRRARDKAMAKLSAQTEEMKNKKIALEEEYKISLLAQKYLKAHGKNCEHIDFNSEEATEEFKSYGSYPEEGTF